MPELTEATPTDYQRGDAWLQHLGARLAALRTQAMTDDSRPEVWPEYEALDAQWWQAYTGWPMPDVETAKRIVWTVQHAWEPTLPYRRSSCSVRLGDLTVVELYEVTASARAQLLRSDALQPGHGRHWFDAWQGALVLRQARQREGT